MPDKTKDWFPERTDSGLAYAEKRLKAAASVAEAEHWLVVRGWRLRELQDEAKSRADREAVASLKQKLDAELPKLREQLKATAKRLEAQRKQDAIDAEMARLFDGVPDSLAELARRCDSRRVFGE